MKLPLTPRPLRADLSAAVKRLVGRALEDQEREALDLAERALEQTGGAA